MKWLLGIPQYVIVAIFIGGAGWTWEWVGDGGEWAGGFSLVGILVFFAAVALLFTQPLPRQPSSTSSSV